MKDNKTFKAFRNTLNESEYSEVLTGYGYRSAHKDGPGLHHLQSAGALAGINSMLSTISRGTYLDPNEALLKMKVRLNVVQLDFDWRPGMIPQGVGSYDFVVRQFGRVDGYDAFTGGIRFDGKANPTGGYTELNLHVDVELNPDSLYVITAKLAPRVEVVPEGVEEDGNAVTEDYQTDARETEMKKKIAKHDDVAQRAYQRRMTGTPKQARRAGKVEGKHDKAITRLLKQDEKEQNSPRTYGRGGKLVKRGSRHEVKEGVEQIEEMHKPGDTVKVPHKGKMVRGKIVRHDSGGSGKAAQHGGGYVVDVGEYSSITVPHHKIVKEEWKSLKKTKADLNAIRASGKKVSVQHGEGDTLYRVSKAKKSVKEEAEQIDELSKATKDAYVAKRGSQLSSMLSGHKRGKQLTGKQQANAVKGIKQAMGVQEALVGGQKRLDVNKNKKLDAQDFALLRAKKKPVQEEAVSEAKMKQWTPRLDKLFGSSRDAVRSKPKKMISVNKIKDGKKVSSKLIPAYTPKKPTK
jgi:hypothetical protein